MIFAVHPVNVESIAWIAQRKNANGDVVSSVVDFMVFESRLVGCKTKTIRFPFSKILCFILHPSILHPLVLGIVLVWRRSYWQCLARDQWRFCPCCVLGIVWWLRLLTIRDLVRTGLFLMVAAVLIVVNLWFQTHGAESVARTAGFIERLLGACAAVWFYLYKAILPIDLVFVYPRWHIEAGNLLWWLPLLATAAVTTLLWLYRKSWSRPFLFAWGFFCTALVPVMGFTNVGFMKYSLVADHYQHIAIIGIIALISAGISRGAGGRGMDRSGWRLPSPLPPFALSHF